MPSAHLIPSALGKPAFLLSFLLLPALPAAETPAVTPGITLRCGYEKLWNKLSARQPVHIAFFGGSITQNTRGHTAMVPDWFRKQYPGVDFTFTNAGLSSTCSTTGAFRLNDDVLAKGGLDLLIVEFAVNDDQDAGHDRATAIRGMEGIVCQVRNLRPEADILQVHFVNPGMLAKVQKGETPVSIAAHEAVAEHYGITSVNVTAALADAIAAGKMTWETYGGTHPHEAGYRLASDLILEALTAGRDHPESKSAPGGPIAPLDAHHYGGAHFVGPQEASWQGGWKFAKVSRDLLPVGAIRSDYEAYQALRGDSPGDSLYLDFNGRAIGAFLLAGPDAGFVEVSIDGGDWRRHDLYHPHSKGLNYPRSILFAGELEDGPHQMALRIADGKNSASQGHAATILYFEVNGGAR